jgi:hypothetical protein
VKPRQVASQRKRRNRGKIYNEISKAKKQKKNNSNSIKLTNKEKYCFFFQIQTVQKKTISMKSKSF